MTQTIVAFTGISGVGKTTFLRKLAQHLPFQHLTGGSLIAAGQTVEGQNRDDLRHSDLGKNQLLLIRGFELARDPSAKRVVMDGHVIIDTASGVAEIDATVFAHLGINLMVHFEAAPTTIAENRLKDDARRRPLLDVETLRRHQNHSRKRANDIAVELGVECIVIADQHMMTLVERLSPEGR